MPLTECGCFAWLGGTSGQDEYGRVRWQEPDGQRRTKSAHKAAYELAKGPVPEGYEVDHLCNMPWCVNPDHLEAVTPEEHIRRREYPIKQFCDKGHPRAPTAQKRGRGYRYECPICRAAYLKEWHAEKTKALTASGYWRTEEYRVAKREQDAARRAANREAYNARKLIENRRRRAAARRAIEE